MRNLNDKGFILLVIFFFNIGYAQKNNQMKENIFEKYVILNSSGIPEYSMDVLLEFGFYDSSGILKKEFDEEFINEVLNILNKQLYRSIKNMKKYINKLKKRKKSKNFGF